MISPRCSKWAVMANGPAPSTRSSRRPTIIFGTRWTKNISISPSPGISTTNHLMPAHMNFELQTAIAEKLDDEAEDPVGQRQCAVLDFVDPARRAGRARAVGLALPHPERPWRTGIRRQPDARGSPPRHGVLQIYPGALGQAHRGWARARKPARRNGGRRPMSGRRSSECRCSSRAWPWARSRPSIPTPTIRF